MREMNRHRASNTVTGLLNLITFLVSLSIIVGAIWMARNHTTCQSFLRTPLLVTGVIGLVVSLAGFIGACYNVVWLLWLYMLIMFLIIVALLAITIFAFAVTARGGGVEVAGRLYREYRLDKYSPLLGSRVEDPHFWETARRCILGSKTCAKLALWTPLDYQQQPLSPIQSGCCKPPTSCNYGDPSSGQDPDCYRWNNAAEVLCYECDSCKAGTLEAIRRDWHRLSILMVVLLVLLIAIYLIGCCAYRNTKRSETGYLYGGSQRIKVRPRSDYFKCWKCWDNRGYWH